MKRFLVLLVSVAVLLGLLTAMVSADNSQSYKLIVGQNEHVGNVIVWIDAGGHLHVRYNVWEGYCLQETHVHAAYSLADIPQVNGNPVPGQFASKHDDLGCAGNDEHVLSGPWATDVPIYIAAHAVVGMPCGDGCWEEETGWGVYCGQMDEYGFPGNNWATYILYPLPWN
jgi:hypothetical protein